MPYKIDFTEGFPSIVTVKGQFLVDSWQYNGTLSYSGTNGNWKMVSWNLTESDGGGMYDIETRKLPPSLDGIIQRKLNSLTFPTNTKAEISDLIKLIREKEIELSKLKRELSIRENFKSQ